VAKTAQSFCDALDVVRCETAKFERLRALAD
jgi:hypothetical protein